MVDESAINRGDICWADMREPRASEPGFLRPVLIVQAQAFNRSRISTVIAVVLTSNLSRADAPGNVLLPSRTCGLPEDRQDLIEFISTVPSALQHAVDAGLRRVLSL